MNYKLNESIEYTGNIVEDILRARGVENPKSYMNVDSTVLNNPLLLDNMETGVELLLKHIHNDSEIYLQTDCDVDGITSAAVFWLGIKRIFPNVKIYFGMHDGKQHGIDIKRIKEGTSLVVCPDAGSNSPETSKILHDMGIDVLVIDHHESDVVDPYAVIINNQMSANYPNKTLSGAGMVYKFLQRLDQVLNLNYADDYLDLVALGVIADLMDLRDLETRYIVKQGLKNIKNPGLKIWIKKQEFSLKDINNLTPDGYSYYIAPLINAIVRVGTEEEKECLFLSFIDGTRHMPSTKRGHKNGDIEICAEQAFRYGSNCRNRQNKILEEAVKYFDFKIQKEELNDNKILLLRLDEVECEKIPSELTGLLAMRLVAKYNKPAIVSRLNSDNEWAGSLRGLNDSAFDNFKKFLEDSHLVTYASGHANAAGTSIPAKNVDKLLDYANKTLSSYDFENSFFKVDFVINKDNLDLLSEIIREVDSNKTLWGTTVFQPKIAVEDFEFTLDDVDIIGGGTTVKIQCGNITFIKFKDKEFAEKMSFLDYGKITFIGTAQMSEYKGYITPQLVIHDYELIDNSKGF